MSRRSLLAATALGLALVTGPALGQWEVTNPISDAISWAINAVQKAAILTKPIRFPLEKDLGRSLHNAAYSSIPRMSSCTAM